MGRTSLQPIENSHAVFRCQMKWQAKAQRYNVSKHKQTKDVKTCGNPFQIMSMCFEWIPFTAMGQVKEHRLERRERERERDDWS
jgi:hypothetical protein